MRVLFIAEVFPMRNSFTEHSLVAREFLTNISSLLHAKDSKISDARLLCNNQTMELLFQDFIRFVPSVIRLNDSTSRFLDKELKDWSLQGLESWKSYVNNNGAIAEKVSEELKHIKNDVFDYDMLIFWGENKVLDDIARQLDIPCVHMELSSTRLPFFEGRTVDLLGANGSASFKNIKLEDLKNNLTPPSIDFWPAFYNIEEEDNFSEVGFDDSSTTYWENDHTLKIFREGKKKTALVGLQLFDDANTQRHSRFSSPTDFLKSVVPKLTEAGWNIIIKTHPGAIHRPVNFLEQKKALAYAKAFNNCYIYSELSDHRNYLSLLKSVDLVVVINSSMGFEAALLGKTVVLEGEALYKIANIFPSLDEVISNKFKNEDYLVNISYLTYFFSKYVFLERKILLKNSFYIALNDYWDANKNILLNGGFSIESYISSFEEYSRRFINNSEELESLNRLPKVKSIIESFVLNSPRRGESITKSKSALFVVDRSIGCELEEGISSFSIDTSILTDRKYILEGWAFENKRKTPPVICLIIHNNKILHVGRFLKRRKDVQVAFELTHCYFGFKYEVSDIDSMEGVDLVFLYSDGKAEVVNINVEKIV